MYYTKTPKSPASSNGGNLSPSNVSHAAASATKYLLGNLLPSFAIVEDAGHHDSKRAETVTTNLGDGDILIADRTGRTRTSDSSTRSRSGTLQWDSISPNPRRFRNMVTTC